MTKNDWLQVAMIAAVIITAAATLLGPALAVIVQMRLSQPKSAADPNRPQSLFQRVEDWLGKHLWIVVGLSLIWSFVTLTFGMRLHRSNQGATTLSIILIAYSIGNVYYTIIWYFFLRVGGRLFQAIDELRNSKQD